MKDDWWGKFITYDGWNGDYIAWDETQANELGRFLSYDTAKEAVLEYAKTLNKKETKMDFQLGDKVVCLLSGAGEVMLLKQGSEYPVNVEFDNGEYDAYTENGYMYESSENPSLFHEGTEINIKPAEPKRYPWVNIYLNDGRVEAGLEFSDKEEALKWTNQVGYIDTIQLKPKREEK